MPVVEEIYIKKSLKNKKLGKKIENSLRGVTPVKKADGVKIKIGDLNSNEKTQLLAMANASSRISQNADNLMSPDRLQMFQRDKYNKDITIKKRGNDVVIDLKKQTGAVFKKDVKNFIGQTEFVNDRLSFSGQESAPEVSTPGAQATTSKVGSVFQTIGSGANLLSSILGGGSKNTTTQGSSVGVDYSATVGRPPEAQPVKILGMPPALFWTILVILVLVGLYALSKASKK